MSTRFELFKSDGDWHWRLNDEGEIIAEGHQSFSNKREAKQYIQRVRGNAQYAGLEIL